MKRFLALLLLLVGMLLPAGPAIPPARGDCPAAPTPIYVGVDSKRMNACYASQSGSMWCWAASLEMLFNYYGVKITQREIVARSCGLDPNGPLPDVPGSWPVIQANLNNWNIDNNGKVYAVQAEWSPGYPSPVLLVEELTAKHPIPVGYATSPTSGHMVLITACSYISTPMGPYIQQVVVRDPDPDPANVQNHGMKVYPAVAVQNVNCFWSVQVLHP